MSDNANQSYSLKYPLAGYRHTGLCITGYEVCSASECIPLNPNASVFSGIYENLELGAPSFASHISGAPGYLFRTNEIEIALTAKELYRLFRQNLQPDEYRTLAETVGVFYEISSKFYDEDTGLAKDPQYTQAEEVTRQAENLD